VDSGVVANNPTVAAAVATAVASNREDTAAAAKLQLTTSNSREAPVANGNRARHLSLGFAVVPLLRCDSISKMH
jgi:patatin-like phospholipase/acyl hydrolase